MEHDVVPQAWGTVDAYEDGVLDGGAKAHCQPVCPCARPLVVGPCVGDQPSSFAIDIGGASCCKWTGKKTQFIFNLQKLFSIFHLPTRNNEG